MTCATGGNHDQPRAADIGTALPTRSDPASGVIVSRAFHHMCNVHTRLNSIKKHCELIVNELKDDNDVSVCRNGLIHISQDYNVEVLCTPTFGLSLLSINQSISAGYTSAFGPGKCSTLSASMTIIGNWVKDLDMTTAPTAVTSAVPSVSIKSTSRRGMRK